MDPNEEQFDPEFMYIMRWTQDYPELQEVIDREMNSMLELSNYKEANEVIASIKKKL
jgi:hypothetical protein